MTQIRSITPTLLLQSYDSLDALVEIELFVRCNESSFPSLIQKFKSRNREFFYTLWLAVCNRISKKKLHTLVASLPLIQQAEILHKIGFELFLNSIPIELVLNKENYFDDLLLRLHRIMLNNKEFTDNETYQQLLIRCKPETINLAYNIIAFDQCESLELFLQNCDRKSFLIWTLMLGPFGTARIIKLDNTYKSYLNKNTNLSQEFKIKICKYFQEIILLLNVPLCLKHANKALKLLQKVIPPLSKLMKRNTPDNFNYSVNLLEALLTHFKNTSATNELNCTRSLLARVYYGEYKRIANIEFCAKATLHWKEIDDISVIALREIIYIASEFLAEAELGSSDYSSQYDCYWLQIKAYQYFYQLAEKNICDAVMILKDLCNDFNPELKEPVSKKFTEKTSSGARFFIDLDTHIKPSFNELLVNTCFHRVCYWTKAILEYRNALEREFSCDTALIVPVLQKILQAKPFENLSTWVSYKKWSDELLIGLDTITNLDIKLRLMSLKTSLEQMHLFANDCLRLQNNNQPSPEFKP